MRRWVVAVLIVLSGVAAYAAAAPATGPDVPICRCHFERQGGSLVLVCC